MMSSQVTPPTEWSSAGEWASVYRAYGMAVIPSTVSSDGQKKHPLGTWKDFQDAGIPQAVHDRWYAPKGSHQFSNTMGTLTGRACFGPDFSLLVIDVDVKGGKRGLETWRGWLDVHNNGLEIETWTVRTGSGGLHLYFRYPRASSIRNTQEKVEGIDVRAEGGFVVMPPSPHYLPGKEYEWVDGCAPWETDIADAPTWLIEEAQSLSDLSLARTDRITQTEQPDRCEDVFGNTIDGRDKKMADVAYAAMLDAYRMCPIKPGLADLETIVQRAFSAYLAHTETRIPKDGRSKEQRLDEEGRGLKAFREKIARHYRGWDSYLADAARKAPRTVLERKIEEARVGETDALTIVHSLGDWMAEDASPDHQWFLERCMTAGLAVEVTDPETGEIGFEWVRDYKAPEPIPSIPEASSSSPFSAAEFIGDPPPVEWLVEEWIPRGVIVALYGDGGVGKTLIAQQLLYAAAIGSQWLGMEVPKLRGMGVFCEDDRDELHRRHNAIRADLGVVLGNPFEDVWIWPRVGEDNLLVTFDKDNRPTMSAFFADIMKHVLEKRIEVLVLDTAADLFGGNEIIRTQVNFFIKSTCGAFIRKAKEGGWTLTTILLAHPSQSGKESGRGDGGSTAWNNAVRARLYLTKPEDGGQNDRLLSRKKANYAASGDETALHLEWFQGVIRCRQIATSSAWPSKHDCELILSFIADAWESGTPLSTAPQTKKEGRYAPRVIGRRFSMSEILAGQVVESWLENRILSVQIRNSDTKIKGLKVVGRLTEVTEVCL